MVASVALIQRTIPTFTHTLIKGIVKEIFMILCTQSYLWYIWSLTILGIIYCDSDNCSYANVYLLWIRTEIWILTIVFHWLSLQAYFLYWQEKKLLPLWRPVLGFNPLPPYYEIIKAFFCCVILCLYSVSLWTKTYRHNQYGIKKYVFELIWQILKSLSVSRGSYMR